MEYVIVDGKVRNILYGSHDPYKDLDLLPEDLQGWGENDGINGYGSRSSVFREIIQELRPKLIVEVGSWKGRSAVYMANICSTIEDYGDFEIVCIDTFLGSVEHWNNLDPNLPRDSFKNGRPQIYQQFLSNVHHHELTDKITPFPIDSINGALTLKHYGVRADLIYIDAGHEYPSVKADLLAYKDVLRDGGYLLGDDWFHEPIKKAAHDVFGPSVITKARDKFLWKK